MKIVFIAGSRRIFDETLKIRNRLENSGIKSIMRRKAAKKEPNQPLMPKVVMNLETMLKAYSSFNRSIELLKKSDNI